MPGDHDFLQALLRTGLPDKIDDIVVEFGNALYQDSPTALSSISSR